MVKLDHPTIGEKRNRHALAAAVARSPAAYWTNHPTELPRHQGLKDAGVIVERDYLNAVLVYRWPVMGMNLDGITDEELSKAGYTFQAIDKFEMFLWDTMVKET
tara:strand:+ start:1036 stop:1347 length:312 start_codon:yes stop_codon:yes gene_type:complete